MRGGDDVVDCEANKTLIFGKKIRGVKNMI